MRVPTCNEVRACCICCGKEIKPHEDHVHDSINVAVWEKAVVSTIFGGYRSATSGKMFMICVCDTCIDESEKNGRVHCFFNKYDMGEAPIEKTSVRMARYEIDLHYFDSGEENDIEKNE